MLGKYKHDIAFSFVEADRDVVDKVADELRRDKRLNCYIYTEHQWDQAGDHIIEITQNVYLRRSRFVLMFASKDFVNGFWSRVERYFLFAYMKRKKVRIISLRLDETPVAGILEGTALLTWNNDPEGIASILITKVREAKKRELLARAIRVSIISLLFALCAIWYWLFYLPVIKPGIYPFRSLSPIEVTQELSAVSRDSISSKTSPKRFWINQTEVTVAEYRRYCDAKGESMPPQPWPVLDNNPVVNITWLEARFFCEWNGGRLPSEAEWKQAADASLQTKYSGGNNASKVAVYNRKHFRPVATKSANAFGLYDMSGNVAEWCETAADSTDIYKIVKGGSYKDGISGLLITACSVVHKDTRLPYIGFRIAWDHKSSK